MSTSATVMMVVSMAVIWGGLVLAIVNLARNGSVEDRTPDAPRDR